MQTCPVFSLTRSLLCWSPPLFSDFLLKILVWKVLLLDISNCTQGRRTNIILVLPEFTCIMWIGFVRGDWVYLYWYSVLYIYIPELWPELVHVYIVDNQIASSFYNMAASTRVLWMHGLINFHFLMEEYKRILCSIGD